jgi:hypothetical protein
MHATRRMEIRQQGLMVRAVAIGVTLMLLLSGIGYGQDNVPREDPGEPPHPWSYVGDPTNDLPGTLHDFSSTAYDDPNGRGVPLVNPNDPGCIACHDGPDWNHTRSLIGESADGYGVSLTTENSIVRQPTQPTTTSPVVIGPESGLCLDCHDGTVKLGDFPGSVAPNMEMRPAGIFGTDLRHHHPVSFDYPVGDVYNLNPSTGGTGGNSRGDPSGLLIGENKTIECVTCHDQHSQFQENNPTDAEYHGSYRTGNFVRMRSICFFCHPRYQDDLGPDRNPGILPADVGGAKTASNGHHFPGRDDPYGIARGTKGVYTEDWDQHNQKFACVMCHIVGDVHLGHNSDCRKCHTRWEPDPEHSPAPTDEASKGHHGTNRWDPMGLATNPANRGDCYLCHADPVTRQLTGTSFGSITTPSCSECHTDIWSQPLPIEVTYSGDTEGTVGEEASLSADVQVPGSNTSYTGDISYQWYFGDGTAPEFPVTVKSNGSVAAKHTYSVAGTYTGYISVTAEGMSGPVVQEFTVIVSEPAPPEPDMWVVTEDVEPDDIVFEIMFDEAPGSNGDVLTGTKVMNGATSLAFGTKMGGVIFWIDMEFSLQSWGVGNTYFGNIGDDEMSGVVITPTGGFHSFSAELD